MPNYLEVLSNCFPTAQAYTRGNPTLYSDLIWVTTQIPQATLDTSQCGLGTYHPQTLNKSIQSWYGYVGTLTGTTKFNSSENLPSITQGTEIWSKSIVLNDASHKIKISTTSIIDSSKNNTIGIAIFRDSTCICSTILYTQGASKPNASHITNIDDTGSTLTRTYSCRIGIIGTASTGTWNVNTTSNGDTFSNTTSKQSFIIEEFE